MEADFLTKNIQPELIVKAINQVDFFATCIMRTITGTKCAPSS